MASAVPLSLYGLLASVLLLLACTVHARHFHTYPNVAPGAVGAAPKASAQAARLMGPPEDWQKFGRSPPMFAGGKCLWQMQPCNPWDDKCCPGMRCLNYAQGYCLKGLESCACFPDKQPVDNFNKLDEKRD